MDRFLIEAVPIAQGQTLSLSYETLIWMGMVGQSRPRAAAVGGVLPRYRVVALPRPLLQFSFFIHA